jgi:hypothetical protein
MAANLQGNDGRTGLQRQAIGFGTPQASTLVYAVDQSFR